ncbi:DUF2019 domain-containing protein [Bosea lathyri]|uniref:DUF2019 domain-containing protein n=1 Tax=Bosea lathyri TaxID=1036778 RepID=A0A1H6C1R5_9HYPH|nr:DUF2019 domain-containing protein [Bosea lathyri]SEG66813.1 protein of unknown function [Bosea lathyri]
MTAAQYTKMSVSELVQEFEALCIAQYHSTEREEISEYNKRYKRIVAVQNELKSRDGDQRRALQTLFGQGNLQVRYMAAHVNLAVDYDKARQELEAIAATKWYPQAAEAGMTLENLDSGFYRPR